MVTVVSPAPLPTARRMTLTQWAALDEDVEGELVDGVLVEEEVASYLHEIVVAWLVRVLGEWSLQRRAFVVGSEAKIAVGPRSGRKPDVSVFLGEYPPVNTTLARRPPHMVIEVVSPRSRDARRDRIDKIQDYASAGVRFYWLIDPKRRTLEILRREANKRFARALDSSAGRVERVPGCEGLVLDLDQLWREVDRAIRASRPPKASSARRGAGRKQPSAPRRPRSAPRR
jgi:Uma2 family endonuclease